MKKVAIVCAAGRQGTRLVNEAVSRGYDVTGFVRGEDKVANPKAKTVVKDLFDLTREDLAGSDVVIDAFGAWTPETLPLHSQSLAHLCDILSGTPTRLLVVGGASSLYVNPEHTACVADGPDFPAEFLPLARAQGKALGALRTRKDVRWTFLSPAADFQPGGARTGSYILGGEELILNAKGESVISYADYAIAMVDEAVSGNHIQQRISAVSA